VLAINDLGRSYVFTFREISVGYQYESYNQKQKTSPPWSKSFWKSGKSLNSATTDPLRCENSESPYKQNFR